MPTISREVYRDGVLVATDVVEVPQEIVNRDDVQVKMRQALAINATYLAIANPTNAQIAVQVQRLTRECNALLRTALNALDDVAGT